MLSNPDTRDGVSQFLEALKRDGDYESSGSFSLDSKTSLEKLKKFRLRQPAELVLHLVACASHRGATKIQFEIGPQNLRLAFDGKHFTQSEMETIFSSYFSSDYSAGNRSRTELAVALQTIQSFNPDFVVLESWNGSCGKVMQLYEGQVWLESLDRQVPPQQQESSFQYLCYEERESFLKYCFPTLTRANRPELNLLKLRCGYGPAQLWLNGTRVQPELPPTVFCFIGPGPRPYIPRFDPARVHEAPFWGLLAHHPDQYTSVNLSTIHWIVGGVDFLESQPEGFPVGMEIIVHAPELRKDLSHGNLLRDEAFAQRVEQVKQSLRELILAQSYFNSDLDAQRWAGKSLPPVTPKRRRRSS